MTGYQGEEENLVVLAADDRSAVVDFDDIMRKNNNEKPMNIKNDDDEEGHEHGSTTTPDDDHHDDGGHGEEEEGNVAVTDEHQSQLQDKQDDDGNGNDNTIMINTTSSSTAAEGGDNNIDDDGCSAAPATKRRRSQRDTNRLVWDKSSLYYRRMRQLFWNEHPFTTSLANNTPGGGRIGQYKLRLAYQQPHIYTIDNFLSPTDLDYLRTKISTGKFEKSFLDTGGTTGDPGHDHDDTTTTTTQKSSTTTSTATDTAHRTSTFLSFGHQQDARVAAIERKAAAVMGCSVSKIEPLQLVRYERGQFFGMHHDLANECYEDDNYDGKIITVSELPPKSYFVQRRLVTIFCYINNVESGGSTIFHNCPTTTSSSSSTTNESDNKDNGGDDSNNDNDNNNILKVSPSEGKAVVFCNILNEHGQPDPRTVHAGGVVDDGVKYGLNIWITE